MSTSVAQMHGSANASTEVPLHRINWSLLAVIRFALSFIVVNHHIATYFYAGAFSNDVASLGGKAAVIGFLLISGFSISASLARSPERFLFRRLVRIYPAYVAAIAFAVALQSLLGRYVANGRTIDTASAVVVAGNLLLLQMIAVKAIAYVGPVWSLSLEFSYYIVARIERYLPSWALPTLALVSLVSFLLPASGSASVLYQFLVRAPLLHYIWPFLFGMALYRWPRSAVFVVLTIVSIVATKFSSTTPDVLSVVTVGGTLCAIYCASRGIGSERRVAQWLGDVSYPLYLIHLPLFIAIDAYSDIKSPAIYLITSIGIAATFLFMIEAPFRKYLLRLGSQRISLETEMLESAAPLPGANKS